MKWTRETLRGTAIQCTGPKQGQRIIEFYESFGFRAKTDLTARKESWIGVIDAGAQTRIDAHERFYKSGFNRVISLPRKPAIKFPTEMLVSDDSVIWKKRLVFCKLPKPISKFVANRHSPETKGMEKQNTFLKSWKFAKEIE